jgi:endonuclease/exonuclease/phosphatase (EEP) superfamily protein YafD
MNWISTGEFQEIGEGTRRRPCTSGQAILSRAPLESSFTVRFHDQASLKWTLNPAQPRRGGRVALAAATHGILCYSLHLESGADDNLRARQVNEIVGDSRSRSGPIIIAGDFNNAAGPDSPMFTALLTAVFVNTMSPDSPPARRPIDWIFARSLRGIASVELAREASDHDPVVLVAAPQP